MWRTGSLEKTLMLGKIEGRRRKGRQRMRWLDGITDRGWTWVWASSRSWWWTGKPGVLQSTGSQRVRHNWVTELNWAEDAYLKGSSPPVWRMHTASNASPTKEITQTLFLGILFLWMLIDVLKENGKQKKRFWKENRVGNWVKEKEVF